MVSSITPPTADGDPRPVWRSLATFYLLALIITWVAWAPLVASQAGLGWLPFDVPMPWVIVGTAGPMLAAMIVQWRERRSLAVGCVRVPWRRALSGGGLAVGLLAATFVVGTSLLMTQHPPHGWDVTAVRLYGTSLIATFAAGPIFEEWGWRGFAQSHLQKRMSPAIAALIVGLGQGLWHLPLFLIPTWSSASLLPYVAMVSALSVIIAWGFNLSGRSIIVAIVLHATFNASSRVLGGFLGDAKLRPWPDGVTAILIALATVAVVITVASKGRLAAPRC